MNQQPAPDAAEKNENATLTYQGSRVPWYIFALWLAFFAVFGVYMFVNALPSIRRLMTESKFDTFPF